MRSGSTSARVDSTIFARRIALASSIGSPPGGARERREDGRNVIVESHRMALGDQRSEVGAAAAGARHDLLQEGAEVVARVDFPSVEIDDRDDAQLDRRWRPIDGFEISEAPEDVRDAPLRDLDGLRCRAFGGGFDSQRDRTVLGERGIDEVSDRHAPSLYEHRDGRCVPPAPNRSGGCSIEVHWSGAPMRIRADSERHEACSVVPRCNRSRDWACR